MRDHDRLRAAVMQSARINRRQLLVRGVAFGLSAPVLGGLLAACGDDDDGDDVATPAPTAEPSPTEEAGDPSPTSPPPSPTAPPADAESGMIRFDGGDRLMGKSVEPAGTTGGTLIKGLPRDIGSINAINLGAAAHHFLGVIFETPWETHPDTLEAVGNLAESWEISDDGLTWIVYVRQGVSWHDGEPLTAEDFKFSFDLSDAAWAYYRGIVLSTEIVDEMAVQFNLERPFVDLPFQVNDNIVARHVYGDLTPEEIMEDSLQTGQDPARVIGTGPFKFEERIPDDRAEAVRNDDYWDGTPHLDRFVVKVVPNESAAIAQLRTGEID